MKNFNLNKLISNISYLIKHKEDYLSASKIILDNSITMANLRDNTFKLSQVEIAKLADQIIKNKKR